MVQGARQDKRKRPGEEGGGAEREGGDGVPAVMRETMLRAESTDVSGLGAGLGSQEGGAGGKGRNVVQR